MRLNARRAPRLRACAVTGAVRPVHGAALRTRCAAGGIIVDRFEPDHGLIEAAALARKPEHHVAVGNVAPLVAGTVRMGADNQVPARASDANPR